MTDVARDESWNSRPAADRARDGAAESHAAGSQQGMRVLSYLLAGPLGYGGLGWALDFFWLHTGYLLPIGIVVGLGLSIYLIIKRFGGDVVRDGGRRSEGRTGRGGQR